jgi:alanine dehydrogenase
VVLYIDDDIVASQLSQQDAFECVDKAFRLLAEGEATNGARRRSQSGSAILNVMWALAPTECVMGVKAYPVVGSAVVRGNVLTLLMYSMTTGELLAVVKADQLGQLRTAAATAVATKAMARSDSEILSIYGTGFQAEAQIKALLPVMPQLRAIRVVGRSQERRDAFISRIRSATDVDVRSAEPEAAARLADIIVTATGTTEPVLEGSWVLPGTHINAVGSNTSTKREVDRTLLEKATSILVDDREVASIDCGDLLANGWDPAHLDTIGDLLLGRTSGRSDPEEITLFESQGTAIQDVVCAARVLSRVDERGLGITIA